MSSFEFLCTLESFLFPSRRRRPSVVSDDDLAEIISPSGPGSGTQFLYGGRKVARTPHVSYGALRRPPTAPAAPAAALKQRSRAELVWTTRLRRPPDAAYGRFSVIE